MTEKHENSVERRNEATAKAKEALEGALGVRQEKIPELSPEEEAEGLRLIRTSDALSLMRMALDGDIILDGEHKEDALNELRHLEEDAENALRWWQRKHGIPV
jgi:hypothetical protein